MAIACVVVLAACKSSDERRAPQVKAQRDARVVPQVSEVQPPPTDLCDAYDRAGVATVLGWKGMQKTSATGLKHGDKRERHCGYRSLDDKAKDAMFSVSFDTDLEPIKKHIGYDIAYAPRAPIDGMNAWSGYYGDVAALQVVAKGLRISLELAKAGTPEEMEQKLVDAARKVVSSLPADPLPLMHK